MSDKIRILIVDDAGTNRTLLARLLEFMDGAEVVGFASNGVEAIAQAETLTPAVILMDISMPEMDGLTATAQIMQKMSPPPAIVIVSTESDSVYLKRATDAGAVDYLPKPPTIDQLHNAVANAYAARYTID
jgi:CheY-like chemotaxis protein